MEVSRIFSIVVPLLESVAAEDLVTSLLEETWFQTKEELDGGSLKRANNVAVKILW